MTEGKKMKKFTKKLETFQKIHREWGLHWDKKSAKHPPVQTLPTTEMDSCSERKTVYEQRHTHSQPPTCIVKSRKSVIFKKLLQTNETQMLSILLICWNPSQLCKILCEPLNTKGWGNLCNYNKINGIYIYKIPCQS